MKKTILKFLSLSGLLGPVLFTVIVLICAGLRTDYNHASQYLSELGAIDTPNADLMNFGGVIPLGILIILFGQILFFRLLPKSSIARIGSIFIILTGLGIFISGIFLLEIRNIPENTTESLIHSWSVFFAILSAMLGILLIGISFRKSDIFRSFWIYSIATFGVSMLFLIALMTTGESSSIGGIWQRLLELTLFIWLGSVSIKLFRTT